MPAPTIAGFRPVPPAAASEQQPIAVLTIEHGPWIVGGIRLHRAADGTLYLRNPPMRARTDRIVLRSGPERDALLAQADRLLRAIAREADQPVAGASDQDIPNDRAPE